VSDNFLQKYYKTFDELDEDDVALRNNLDELAKGK